MKKAITILALLCSVVLSQPTRAADTNLWDAVPFLSCTSRVDELNLTLDSAASSPAGKSLAAAALLANHVSAGVTSLELTNAFRTTTWLRAARIVTEPKPNKVMPSCIISFTNTGTEVRMMLSPDPKTEKEVIGLFDGTFHSHIHGFSIKSRDAGWLILFSRGPEYDYLQLYGEDRSELLPRRKAKCRKVQP